MEVRVLGWLKNFVISSKIKNLIVANSAIVFAAVAFCCLFLFLSKSSGSPTIESSLGATPDWASGFDIYITFPLLTLLCLVPFRTTSKWNLFLLTSLVSGIPIAFVVQSYYLFYGLSSIGFIGLGVPDTLLLPTTLLIVVLAIPTIVTILLSFSINRSKNLEIRSNVIFRNWSSKYYFVSIAILSLSIALFQTYLRASTGPPLTGWVSDVGITVEAGARDLVHGIDPYTHGLPPWGGGGGGYGPITYLLVVPFVYFAQGWGAHIGTLVFSLLTGLGIWKCVRLYFPHQALASAALFLALPMTSWIVESGIISHMIMASLIVWSLYFFLKGSYLWAGIFSALGTMALVIPGVLLIPFLAGAKGWKSKLRVFVGFFGPIVVGLSGLLAVLPPNFLTQQITGDLATQLGGGGGWLTVDLILSPASIRIYSIIFTGWLLFWFVYRVAKDRKVRITLIASIAVLLLLIPFTTGGYFVYYYVWASAAVIVSIFINPSSLRKSLGSQSQEQRSLGSMEVYLPNSSG